MSAALAIARMTTRQVLGVRRSVLIGLAELMPAVILLIASLDLTAAAALDRAVEMTVALYFPLVVPVVTMVLAASALGAERRDGTLPFVLLRPIPRTSVAGAKLAGAAAASVAAAVVGGTALGIATAVATGSWALLLPLVVGGAIAAVAYCALFVPIGFLTDRAVVLGLIFVFVFENGILYALTGLATLSPWRIGLAAYAGMAPEDAVAVIPDIALGNVAAGLGGAVVKMLVIAALSVGFVTWLFRSRDLA